MMTYHVQFLLLVLAGWVNRQQQDVIDYLQEENRVLRAGLRGKRLKLSDDERHQRRILRKYVDYYHSCRTHLSLEKDAPEPRRVESPAMGKVSAIPKVGGLHHYYTRRAA